MSVQGWQYESEREWQQYVVQLAHARGWSVFHVPDSRRTTPGWPDLALLRAPDFMLVELKSAIGRVSRIQQRVLDDLVACGVEVHVWRPENEAEVRARLKGPPPTHGGVYDWQNDGGAGMKHPAKFTDVVLDTIATIGADFINTDTRVLDPFAGTGRVHALPFDTYGVELEHEWSTMHPRNIMANTLALPFANRTFGAVVTSPCYGNRFADHHVARDGSRRRSYTHDIGHALHTDNAGAMQWSERYRLFHECAWREVTRVCTDNAVFMLNVSDHIRNRHRMPVVGFHLVTLQRFGWCVVDVVPIVTPRLRDGENADACLDAEVVAVLVKGEA